MYGPVIILLLYVNKTGRETVLISGSKPLMYKIKRNGAGIEP
jgi:hypothetical protein